MYNLEVRIKSVSSQLITHVRISLSTYVPRACFAANLLPLWKLEAQGIEIHSCLQYSSLAVDRTSDQTGVLILIGRHGLKRCSVLLTDIVGCPELLLLQLAVAAEESDAQLYPNEVADE
jgi:hypothetical protein